MRTRGAGLALATLLLALVAACGEAEEGPLTDGGPDTTTSSSPTTDAPPFAMPAPGDAIGGEVTTRPPDEQTARSAGQFAAWALSLLLHTPREDASTDLWSGVAASTCEPCRGAAEVWQEQAAKGQVFAYDGTPRFERTAVRAQRQGDGWFVQHEVAVPRSTLSKGEKVLQSADAETLGYSFNLVWTDDAWQVADFHVLG